MFALGRAGLVAVVSSDSDFGALFVKMREMAIQKDWGRTPFLWVTIEGGGALSPEVQRFVPDEFRWEVSPNETKEVVPTCEDQPTSSTRSLDQLPASLDVPQSRPVNDEIVRYIPVGTFSASDAQKVVLRHVGTHPSIPANQARFAQFLLNDVAPALDALGVLVD